MKKYFLIVLIVLVLFGLLYWWQNVNVPKPPRITDPDGDITAWQTYRNEKYGFEFKYPSGWETPIEKNGRVSIGIASPENYSGKKLEITIVDGKGKTLDQEMADLNSEPYISLSNIEDTFLDSVEAKQFVENRQGGFVATNLYVVKGQYFYKIWYGNRLNTDPVPEAELQVKNILSTFRFIN